MSLEDELLVSLRPSPAQRRHMDEVVARLLQRAQQALEGSPASASVQGSIAKDTWLAGTTDIDLFLLAPPETPEEDLPGLAQRVAEAVLHAPRARYAQHPYLVGEFDGMQVDVVPAYAVAEAAERMSAVDRTPFHTAWVREHLDEDLRDAVRLAKQWLQGVGAYGAETAVAGFSGYLVEVLVAQLGSFPAVIDWLAGDARPRRMGPLDDDAPLVVPDPVDAARNCAAAVSKETLAHAVAAANAYRAAPSRRFFFPSPPRGEPPHVMHDALAARGETWLGIEMPQAARRLDIVFPQFQKAARRITESLQRAGFTVHAHATWTNESMVGMQWRLDGRPLPATRTHRGPAAGSGPHAQRFRQKWQGHAEAASDIQEEAGRLQVDVVQRQRTPEAWLREHVPDLGKHAGAALRRSRILGDPADVVSAWSPAVADFILERQPWQR